MLIKAFKKFDTWAVRKIGLVRARRIGRFLVGFIPSIGTLAFIIHCATLLMGYDMHVAGFMFKYAFLWFCLMTILSIAYEFCWVHRAFCLYNFLMTVCIEHQRVEGFGTLLTPMRWFALIIGLALIFAFWRNNCWKDFYQHTKQYK